MSNTEPSAPLLRLRDVMAWLNVSKKTVISWVDCELIHPFYKSPGSRAWYRKAEIKEKILR